MNEQTMTKDDIKKVENKLRREIEELEERIYVLENYEEDVQTNEVNIGEIIEKLKIELEDNVNQRTSTVTIAPFNASEESKANANIILKGDSSDVTTINEAIQGLPTNGGQLLFLEGEVACNSVISINKANVTITGQGSSTVFKRYGNSFNLFHITKSTCAIEKVNVDGNRSAYGNSANHGIHINNCHRTLLNDITFNSNYTGLYLTGATTLNVISNIICSNNNNGIYLGDGSNYNVISGNSFNNGDNGITIPSKNQGNNIFGNTFNSNKYGINNTNTTGTSNLITDNNFYNHTEIGIKVSGNNYLISRNSCNHGKVGIEINGKYANITMNICNNNSNCGMKITETSYGNLITMNQLSNNTVQGLINNGEENLLINNLTDEIE